MNSITILSDDPDGIKSLINRCNFVTHRPNLAGKGVQVIQRIRDVFGGHTTVRDMMLILKDHPELIEEINETGIFKVNHVP